MKEQIREEVLACAAFFNVDVDITSIRVSKLGPYLPGGYSCEMVANGNKVLLHTVWKGDNLRITVGGFIYRLASKANL